MDPQDFETQLLTSSHGRIINQSGGIYRNGVTYDTNKRLSVAVAYIAAMKNSGGSRPNISHLAAECQVSRPYILGIEDELKTHGRILDPSEKIKDIPRGPGSKSMDEFDMFIILVIYYADPTTTLHEYSRKLQIITGAAVSKSVISRFLLKGFLFKGTLCKPNKIPYDKFRPQNLAKADEYLFFLSLFYREKIKFCDHKHAKTETLYNRKARKDPLTGLVPPVLTYSDFRNTYSIFGITSIDIRTTPLRWEICQGNNDAEVFFQQIMNAIIAGFLLPYDVLVTDNAQIHWYGLNTVLEEFLWDNFRVFVLTLPARAPEWNPIEQVWNVYDQKMQTYRMEKLESLSNEDRYLHAAEEILDGFTHADINTHYMKSGV